MRLADYIQNFTGRHVLEKVAASSRLQRPLNLDVAFKRGEHDDASGRKFRTNGDHRVNAAEVREAKVHQCNVRPMLAIPLNGRGTARRLSDQLHVRVAVDGGCEPLAKQSAV